MTQSANRNGAAEPPNPPPPALILHLYPTHFTLGEHDVIHEYNGPLKDFLETLNRQELPENASELFKESDFHKGCVYVEVRDYRHVTPKLSDSRTYSNEISLSSSDVAPMVVDVNDTSQPHVRTLVLRPTPLSLWADIYNVGMLLGSANSLTEKAALEVESRVLLTINGPLHLDSDPTVARAANIKAYNEEKYRIPRKRPRNWAAKEEDDEKKRESDKMMLLMDERRKGEFHPKFTKYSFVEDWKKKKAIADAETLLTLQDRTEMKRSGVTPERQSKFNSDMDSLVRTLRFQQDYSNAGTTIYTIVNIYQVGHDQYHCTLRWGDTPGTGVAKGSLKGSTIRFPLGNYAAMWWYISQFKSHYQMNNKLVADQTGPYTNMLPPATRTVAPVAAGRGPLVPNQAPVAAINRNPGGHPAQSAGSVARGRGASRGRGRQTKSKASKG